MKQSQEQHRAKSCSLLYNQYIVLYILVYYIVYHVDIHPISIQ